MDEEQKRREEFREHLLAAERKLAVARQEQEELIVKLEAVFLFVQMRFFKTLNSGRACSSRRGGECQGTSGAEQRAQRSECQPGCRQVTTRQRNCSAEGERIWILG